MTNICGIKAQNILIPTQMAFLSPKLRPIFSSLNQRNTVNSKSISKKNLIIIVKCYYKDIKLLLKSVEQADHLMIMKLN